MMGIDLQTAHISLTRIDVPPRFPARVPQAKPEVAVPRLAFGGALQAV
jgi:hypothetical protein